MISQAAGQAACLVPVVKDDIGPHTDSMLGPTVRCQLARAVAAEGDVQPRSTSPRSHLVKCKSSEDKLCLSDQPLTHDVERSTHILSGMRQRCENVRRRHGAATTSRGARRSHQVYQVLATRGRHDCHRGMGQEAESGLDLVVEFEDHADVRSTGI